MANIMDYIPQFKDNTYDLSGYGDDATQQLDLKRKLRIAQALQGQQVPEGQIVSGRYVAPSWTQYLANAAGKVMGAQDERRAIQDYAKVQSAKTQKLADLLKGQEVEQPVDYNEAGNMPGITQTVRKPFSQQEFTSRAVQLMPDLAPKMVETQLAQYGKEKTPIKGAEGDVFFDPVTHEQLFSVPKAIKQQEMFGKVNPQDFTPSSLARFAQTGGKDYSVLEPVAKAPQAPVTRQMRQGNMEITQQWDPVKNVWNVIAQGPAFKPESDSAKETLIFNRTNKLRDDFSSLPEVKAWNVIQPTLVAARQAAQDKTGGSDLNLIYAMGKIMDPNSVVREGELQMAGNTGSLGQKIMGYYKSVANGGRLSPAVKQDLLNQIESRAKAQEALYKNTKSKYTEIAKRNNLNPEDLFVEGITAPPSKAVNFGDLK